LRKDVKEKQRKVGMSVEEDEEGLLLEREENEKGNENSTL